MDHDTARHDDAIAALAQDDLERMAPVGLADTDAAREQSRAADVPEVVLLRSLEREEGEIGVPRRPLWKEDARVRTGKDNAE